VCFRPFLNELDLDAPANVAARRTTF